MERRVDLNERLEIKVMMMLVMNTMEKMIRVEENK